jgi:RNA polymerase sigma-70 factor, ECF subfamily
VPSEAREVPDDIELLRQICRGDGAAFRVLVERESRYLYGIAHALTGNSADAEDLVQETFTGTLKTRFRGEASARTWLVQILVKQAAMLFRSRRRQKNDRSLGLGSREDRANEMTAPAETAGTEARLDLSTMLAELSDEHRTVIVLRELQGMSYGEMAAVLGVPQGTVESRLFRAREELRRRFSGYL